ncbi:MAG: phosphoesterase DHHA1 [Parcubacteria group bacterium Licking1014_17]|nr:MAG: phosphoesterase DHHA1 [Parcubacteria group bacterium Licking1014_17]
MDYSIYYHDDFDGITTGAVLYDFLKKRGDSVGLFHSLDYSPTLIAKWFTFDVKKPCIFIDLRYRKDADMWFDHHSTTFTNPEDEKNYRNDDWHFYDPNAKSSCSMVLKFLEEKHGYKPPEYFADTAHWSDIIDSAFSSPQQAVECKEPAFRLSSFLDNFKVLDGETYESVRSDIITRIASGPIEDIVNSEKYHNDIEKVLIEVQKSNKHYADSSKLIGNLVYTEILDWSFKSSSALPYYIYPEALYAVRLTGGKSGYYKIWASKNAWIEKKGNADIGLLMKKYGGGGHEGVGACNSTSLEEAKKIAEEIIDYLNKD